MKQKLKDGLRAVVWWAVQLYSNLEAAVFVRMKGQKLAILLHSFDGYKRFWQAAAYFTTENLPPGSPLYFASEVQSLSDEGFVPIKTGRGSFVWRLLRATKALEGGGYKYILYLQEDMWLNEPIKGALLEELVALMEAYKLDSLKLGKESFWTPEIDAIRQHCNRLGNDGMAHKFRWFGPHRYTMSHHVTIFHTRFLITSLYAAYLNKKERPIQHEVFCSRYLKERVAASEHDGKRYRIAVWDEQPLLPYIHASSCGQLTEEAASLLREQGLEHYYHPSLAGEVFPEER